MKKKPSFCEIMAIVLVSISIVSFIAGIFCLSSYFFAKQCNRQIAEEGFGYMMGKLTGEIQPETPFVYSAIGCFVGGLFGLAFSSVMLRIDDIAKALKNDRA